MGKKLARFPKSHTVADVEAGAAADPSVEKAKSPEAELAEIQAKAQALHQAKVEACAQEIGAVLQKYGLSLEVGHTINLVPVQRS